MRFPHAGILASVVCIALFLSACGYRPTSKISRDVVGEKISTTVRISTQDPENTVIIKDALDSAVVSVFHASLTSRARSDTHLELSINTPTYAPIQYDASGFVIGYRMSVVLQIVRYHNGLSKKYTSKGSYDFSVDPNAVVTDQQRFNAIKLSAQKAIKAFVAQVAADGVRAKTNEE